MNLPPFFRSLLPLLVVSLAWAFALPASAWQAAEKQPDAPANDANESETDTNEAMYEVPDGDVEQLVAFIKKIQAFEPNNVLEVFAHRKNAGEAIRGAAEKIKELEKDEDSAAYKLATRLLLQVEVGSLPTATPDEQARIYQQVKQLIAQEGATEEMFGLAYQTASGLEYGTNEELAAKAFEEFGELFSKSDNEQLAEVADKLIGASRRLRLPGNPIKIEGKTLSGETFDWKSYEGKVVLIDFWATWCGPCRAELPNIKALYKKFHDQGFDVVGISIDQDRAALEDYVKENKLPWTTLHENNGEGAHPTADYYGVLGIPTMILVGRDGKVLSTHARGEELGAMLNEQFGVESDNEAEKPAEGEQEPAAG
jgi:thiol-disulfide isomerase/thioredoxin